jgi:hypothetical protein
MPSDNLIMLPPHWEPVRRMLSKDFTMQ